MPHIEQKTAFQMLIYTLILIPVTLLPTVIGISGPFYMIAALTLGVGLLRQAIIVLNNEDIEKARDMFFFSIFYLFMIFVSLLLDKCLMSLFPDFFS